MNQPVQQFSFLPTNSPWQGLFLPLASIVILLIVTTFFILPSQTAQRPFQIQSLNFSNPFEQKSFEELLQLGLTTQNRAAAGESLIKAFITLFSEYNRSPSVEKRQALALLASYLEKNFPEETKKVDLSVPCKEEACGAVYSFSDELTAIKDAVSQNSTIDQITKDATIGNLNNAALAAGGNNLSAQFSSLSTAFYTLRNVWEKTKDENIKQLAAQTLALMEKIHPENFKLGIKLNLFNL